MKKKIITAILMSVVLLGVIALKLVTDYVLDAFALIISVLMTYECSNLLAKAGRRNFMVANIIYAMLNWVLVFLCTYYCLDYYYLFGAIVVFFIIYYICIAALSLSLKDTNKMARLAAKDNLSKEKLSFRIALNSASIGAYVGILPSLFVVINHIGTLTRQWAYFPGEPNVLSFIAIVCVFLIPIITDTFAMFGGMLFKGPKLAPTISPQKTISGAVIGTAMSMLFMMAMYLVLCEINATLSVLNDINMNMLNFMLLGMVGAIVSQIGDLLESKLKRQANVKDVSNLLPGHGGFMDRLDSHIFNAPIVLTFFLIIIMI